VAALGLVLAASALPGCGTSFEGAARFPGGVAGCMRQCRNRNLEMSSFIYIGEYSTACVCKPAPNPGSIAAEPEQTEGDEAAVASAVVGVELERRIRLRRAVAGGAVGAALPP
jgi:hypothetical protein